MQRPSCHFKNSSRTFKFNLYIPFKRWTTTWVHILWLSSDFTSNIFGVFWHLTHQEPFSLLRTDYAIPFYTGKYQLYFAIFAGVWVLQQNFRILTPLHFLYFYLKILCPSRPVSKITTCLAHKDRFTGFRWRVGSWGPPRKFQISNWPHFTNSRRHNMAEILPIRPNTLSNQSINYMNKLEPT